MAKAIRFRLLVLRLVVWKWAWLMPLISLMQLGVLTEEQVRRAAGLPH